MILKKGKDQKTTNIYFFSPSFPSFLLSLRTGLSSLQDAVLENYVSKKTHIREIPLLSQDQRNHTYVYK